MHLLSRDFYQRCRTVLLSCYEFSSDEKLRAVFVTSELHPFRSGIPIASSLDARVDLCIEYLLEKGILSNFLLGMRDKRDTNDNSYHELHNLYNDINASLIQSQKENNDYQAVDKKIILPSPQTNEESPHLELDSPEEIIRPDSAFYIERQPSDRIAIEAIQRKGQTLTIKGPRQFGKSSMLSRTLQAAEQANKKVVHLNFQELDQENRADAHKFFRHFCSWIADELQIDHQIIGSQLGLVWGSGRTDIQCCTHYVERHILKLFNKSIVLAMDEVDSILECPFHIDFFSMLRVWHDKRATNTIWRLLDLVLVTCTEPYELIDNLNQSPFNVGEVIELKDFTQSQVSDLNQRHGSPLSVEDERRLMKLSNGHPYLIRRSLFLLAKHHYVASELFATASNEHGPFGVHLRHHAQQLQKRPELIDVLRQILRTQKCSDEHAFWRLHGAGLVRRSGQRVLMRCPIYTEFFRERLS